MSVCVCLGGGGWCLGACLFLCSYSARSLMQQTVTMTHLKVINSTLVSSIVQLLSAGDPQNQQGC